MGGGDRRRLDSSLVLSSHQGEESTKRNKGGGVGKNKTITFI
jgi:hypothetical protein